MTLRGDASQTGPIAASRTEAGALSSRFFTSSLFQNFASPKATMAKTMKALGLCMGASTVSLVQVEQDLDAPGMPSPRITHHSLHTHEGDPKRTLVRALSGLDMRAFDRIAVTGRKFCRFVNLTSVSEPEAVETAYPFVKPLGVDCPAVVSAGGETFMVYVLDRTGRIRNVVTGNKCASGTGEFFLQQLRRMNVSLEEASQWAATETPHHVSGRCSVFCKSDCTHATNKGIPKAQVSAGLCKMMANKVIELLNKVERRDIMVVGGTAQNRMMIEYLRKEIPGLIVPAQAPVGLVPRDRPLHRSRRAFYRRGPHLRKPRSAR
jgi:activator of 2-hydroxyglutaryl-CoA dehydratase